MGKLTVTQNIFVGVILAIILLGCNDSSGTGLSMNKKETRKVTLDEATRQALNKIKDRRIIFAHHSVGGNIINGLMTIAKEAGIKIQVANINENPIPGQYNFVDFNPGRNSQPKTKVDGFVEKIGTLAADHEPDIALMKFCYVDFLNQTDVNEVFAYYKKNIQMLKKTRPGITFVHFTAPLMARSYELKARIMRLVGKEHWIDRTNVKRARYNNLLQQTFKEDPVFDIAKIESTRFDGSRVTFEFNNNTYHSMAPEYTDDGGHLNELGQRVVARAFIHFLADTLK